MSKPSAGVIGGVFGFAVIIDLWFFIYGGKLVVGSFHDINSYLALLAAIGALGPAVAGVIAGVLIGVERKFAGKGALLDCVQVRTPV